jgi:hydroxysqualene synthase
MRSVTRYHYDGLASAIHGPEITSRDWSLDDSFDYCEQLARSHYENFPVGSFLVPRPLRRHFYSIYAFARIADDVADEDYQSSNLEHERLDLIAEWLFMLGRCFEGKASHPVFIALRDTSTRFHLPKGLFEDLLSAFAQDVTVRRYRSFEQLLDYCRRSANPIGRLILLLFGYRDDELHRPSDAVCTALQLANHWQDVAVDLDKDRIYLPEEDLERFGLTARDLERREVNEAFGRLMAFEVERARALFREGRPLCAAVEGRLRLELRAVWLGGNTILDRLQAVGYDVFTARPSIGVIDKLRILIGAASGIGFRKS